MLKKIFLNHFLLILLPVIIIYYLIFSIYTHDKKTETLRFIKQVNIQSMENIDNYVKDMKVLTMHPLYDNDILELLYEKNFGDSALTTGSKGFDFNDRALLSVTLNEILAFNKNIYSVFIFNLNGTNEYRMVDSKLDPAYNPSQEDWFKEANELKGSAVVGNSFRFSNWNAPRGKDFYMFSVTRAIKEIKSGGSMGLISIDSDIDIIRNIIKKMKSFDEERILLLDDNGFIVYDTNETNITKSIGDKSFDLNEIHNLNLQASQSSMQVLNKKSLVDVEFSKETTWKLVSILPEAALFSKIKAIQTRLLTLIIIFVLLSLLLSIVTSYNITKPLKRLIKTMRVVENGDLTIRFTVMHKDEIGRLGHGFNNMINKIDQLVSIVYSTELRKKEAEMNALQSQINPHFMYNTLESIRMTAELNDDTVTAKMTLILGKLLRYSINPKDRLVTIGDEIEHLKNYIMLQNFRFKDKFELIIEMDQELIDIPIIKLIFQPIIENAIFHGLETMIGKGEIKITGYQAENKTIFLIEDNGIGMTAEQLEKLNDPDVTEIHSGDASRGIGLKNVNERIKLHYGEIYGIKITSEQGKGTTVSLELPDKFTMNIVQL
ncbi:sensor histidine kinase [Paenibacillus psychroresistens]|uniref:histidine kinase n=1 Tax=Paenibacillus psychroresistens TaxID=1778678 RepID=A0A6B8RI60_9BACL|nr:sensor histidine kinase [Paenibacillus psychroresistens]QGQ95038.1 sensor histidine kinase [Paenibacillus psychroresistens]